MKRKRFIGWSLIILGVPFYLFFKKYNGELISFSIIYFLIGFAMVTIGIVMVRKTPKLAQIRLIEKAEKLISELKANGLKIEVNLNDCEIKENLYFDRLDYSKNYADFELLRFSELIKFHDKGEVETKQSFVVGKIQVKGVEKKVQSVLPYDRVKLLIYFDIQKNTCVYIDKSDSEKYYFDFEFLREKT